MILEFASAMRRIYGVLPPRRLGLAVSGGVDSMALAGMARAWAEPRGVMISAFIVDHRLRANSTDEAAFTASNLEALGISATILGLPDLAAGPRTTTEKRARDSRRKVLADACLEHGIYALAVGHHRGDQRELLMMRYLQESTWFGRAGMSNLAFFDIPKMPTASSVQIVRPLLDFEKVTLREYCESEGIRWSEDPTNEDTSLTIRNSVRRTLSDFDIFMPPALQPQAMDAAIAAASSERNRIMKIALQALRILKLSGALKIDAKAGAITLDLQSLFRHMPERAQIEFLLALVRCVSPLPSELSFYRRAKVASYVSEGLTPGKVLMNVLITRSNRTKLHLARAPVRRLERSAVGGLFTASKLWSNWMLIDGRFWMRWRLPIIGSSLTRKFRVTVGANTVDLRPVLTRELRISPNNIPRESILQTQPYFAWEDDVSKLPIGYPSLGLYHQLEVDTRFNELVL